MQTLGLVLLVLFSGTTFIALLVTLNMFLPIQVERVKEKIESNLGRTFLVGLINLIGCLAIFFGLWYLIWLFKKPEGPNGNWVDLGHFIAPGIFVVLGVLLGLVLILFIALGLAAMASLLGERVGKAAPAFDTCSRGGLLLVLSSLTPYIGWFVFAPFAVCTGLGATILILFQRKPAIKTEK